MRRHGDALTLKILIVNHYIYESHKTNNPHKSFNHKRQDIPWENPPNMEDEKPNNSLSMIDRFVENGLQHIIIFPNKRCHLSSREEKYNTTL